MYGHAKAETQQYDVRCFQSVCSFMREKINGNMLLDTVAVNALSGVSKDLDEVFFYFINGLVPLVYNLRT